MSLSPQWLDELRSRISLSGLIGRSVRVQKAGREFKACCPFHNEKSPSFTINDDKGFYHCFGCGAHGDAIRWMTDHQGLPFLDAVKELAALAGMDMPAPDPRAAKRNEQAKSLHDAMAAAQTFFRDQLQGDGGAEARRYLATRGFPATIVEQFGFGYAPDARGSLKSALAAFPEALLIEAGLLIATEGRDPYDRFRGRLTLPIADPRGRTIAFGGRILTAAKTDAPKYLNSPDTPLFDKGRTLYNLHRAAPPARSSGRLVVVEGYMDVVALAAAGIAEAVAPLGTALTEDQIERLWQVVPCPVLCFDGDSAGLRAARRAMGRALPLLRPGHSLSIVTLPAGLDPDDVIKRDGPQAIRDLLDGGRNLVEALWETERDASPLATPEDKAGLKQRLIDHCETIAHPDIKALYRRELLERFGDFAFAPRERPAFTPRSQQARGAKPGARKGGPWVPAPAPLAPQDAEKLRRVGLSTANLVAAVLAGFVRHPEAIARHAESLAHLHPDDPAMADLLAALLSLADSPTLLESGDIATILASRNVRLPTPEDYAGLRFGFLTSPDAAAELAEAVDLLVELPQVEAALGEATQRHETEFSEETFAEQQRLLQRRLAMLARLRQMGRAGAAL